MNDNKLPASPLPWRVTAADEKKGREIVDAKGNTVAKLTALDLPNADLIVAGVNALHSVGMRHITDVNDLEENREYWLVDVRYPDNAPHVETCKVDAINGKKYFSFNIWAEPDNNQALQRWDVFGPLPKRPLLDFDLLKQKGVVLPQPPQRPPMRIVEEKFW